MRLEVARPGANLVRHQELGILGPSVGPLGRRDLVDAQCGAVGGGGIVLVRRAEADVGCRDDQGRSPVGDGRLAEHAVDLGQVIAVGDLQHAPSRRGEALGDVVGERQRGRSVEADRVVVVDADQFAEPEVAGERGGLVGDALHQIAIAAHEPGPVVDDLMTGAVELRREDRFGQRETDGIADALAQWPGRDLDSGRVAALRVPRGGRVPLPEVLEVVDDTA